MAGTKIRTRNDQRQYPAKKPKIASDPITYQHNIELIETSNNELERYTDQRTQERCHMNEKELDIFIPKMVKFCRQDPSATLVRAFFEEEGIDLGYARRWAKKWSRFAEAYEYCKGVVGRRLFNGSLKREYDSGTARTALPIFLEEFREESDRVAKQRTEQQQQAGNATFIIKKVDYSKEEK